MIQCVCVSMCMQGLPPGNAPLPPLLLLTYPPPFSSCPPSFVQVTRRTDGKTYALKKVDVSSLDDKELLSALNEIRLLASFAHPRIVRLYETFMGREGGREDGRGGRRGEWKG